MDYTELKRLAEAATPGPWHWVNPRDDSAWEGTGVASLRTTQEFGKNERKEIDGKFYTSFALPKFVASWAEIDEPSDAAYIAAASPDVVLSMIAEIERHRCGTEVLQRLHDEDMAERDKLRTQNQALLEACKTGLEYVEECLIDYDQAYSEHPATKAGRGIIVSDVDAIRAAIKLAEGEDV